MFCKRLFISISLLMAYLSHAEPAIADVSTDLVFVGTISSSSGAGIVLLRNKDSGRTIVTQLNSAFTHQGVVYRVAEVINQGAVVSDGHAQYLLNFIDGRAADGEVVAEADSYDEQAVEEYLEDQRYESDSDEAEDAYAENSDSSGNNKWVKRKFNSPPPAKEVAIQKRSVDEADRDYADEENWTDYEEEREDDYQGDNENEPEEIEEDINF